MKTKEEMIKLAFSFLDRGWSILPCGLDKRPLTSWKLWQTEYPSREVVSKWFDTYSDCQIGIITGKLSNLSVVDTEEFGDPSELPQNTMIVGTGGNGYHHIFLYEEGIRNSARIKKLTDVRSEGGYILSYGSRSSKGPYTLLQDKPLLPFPKHLFPEKVDIFQTAEKSHFEQKTLESYIGYNKGQRNDEMARYIGYVLNKIHPNDWESEAWSIIERANMSNTPPLGSRELRTTFESIKTIEKRNNPLGHSTNNYAVQKEPICLTQDGDEVRLLSEVAKEQKIDLNDIYELGMPVFDEPILGGVYIGDLVTIAGAPSHGKTTLCQQWTMNLLRGSKNVKSLWFTYEMLPARLWEDFKKMGMEEDECVFCPAKHSTGDVAWIEIKIKEAKEKFGIKAVFIDHLGFLLPKTMKGNLNKNMSSNYATYLTQIVRDLKTIAIQEEIMIFMPVHVRKPSSYKRGGIEIEDIANSGGPAQESDLVFLIERIKNTNSEAIDIYLNFTKIYLSKNRHNGVTRIAEFLFTKNQFVVDDSRAKATSDFDSYPDTKGNSEPIVENKEVEKKEEDIVDLLDKEWDKGLKMS